MNQCILHVGMPKTGTSSIQDSLFHGLQDPTFHYSSYEESNGRILMMGLFAENPQHFGYFKQLGWPLAQIEEFRTTLQHHLETAMATTFSTGATLVLSAECVWRMEKPELERIRNFMHQRETQVRILAYIRPYKPWLESSLQERIKAGANQFQVHPAFNHSKLHYPRRVQILESVFGPEHVKVRLYDPRTLVDGCVVADFCRESGISFEPAQVVRSNDSLKLPALQLLYAYQKFSGEVIKGWQAVEQNKRLIQQLSDLEGPPLRLHSSLIEPYREEFERQRAWVEQRLGQPFSEDSYRHDHEPCIRQESDFFDFSPDALLWLARATGNRPVKPASGEAAARKVAAQVHQLSLGGSSPGAFQLLLEKALGRLKRLRDKWPSH